MVCDTIEKQPLCLYLVLSTFILMPVYHLLVLMQSVYEDIEKEHPSVQNSDIVTFFQVAQAVTSFQFHKSLASTVSN